MSNAIITMGSNKDKSAYVVHWSDTDVPGLRFEVTLQRNGAIVFKYSGPLQAAGVGQGYFIGIAAVFPEENHHQRKVRQYTISVPQEHITSDVTIRYDPVIDGDEEEEEKADESNCGEIAECEVCSDQQCKWCQGSCVSLQNDCSSRSCKAGKVDGGLFKPN